MISVSGQNRDIPQTREAQLQGAGRLLLLESRWVGGVGGLLLSVSFLAAPAGEHKAFDDFPRASARKWFESVLGAVGGVHRIVGGWCLVLVLSSHGQHFK